MSKIEELIKNEKVEWKKLGEVGEIKMCKRILKNQTFSKGDIPFYKIGTFGKIADSFIKRDLFNEYKEKYSYPKKGEILISASGTIGRTIIFDGNDSYFQDSNIVWIENNEELVLNKYLYYFYQIVDWNPSSGGTIKRLYNYNLKNIQIPIPSIKTQEKIVKILDKLTNYVTELQAELQARNKQYEFYRDMLLSEEYLTKLFKNTKLLESNYKLRSTTLGDVGKFTRGNGLQKKDFISKGKPVIHYGQIYTKFNFETDKTTSFVNDDVFSKLKKAKSNDILIATTSENIEDVGKCVVWLGNEEIGFSGDMYSYSTKENSKYIAYYFQTNKFQKQKEQKVTGTKLIRIHGDDMAKFSITLPPREIQNKVVEILDKFQNLLSDTQGLLPKEISLRQKQYEYYRQKLLSFSEEK